jgi:exosortase/archaeosortase family protein
MDGSDDPWCLLALVTALFFLLGSGTRRTRAMGSLWVPTGFAIAYGAAAWTLPPIFGCAVAILAVGSTLLYFRHGRFFHPGVWGLLLLSVPLVASLQFYLGYPLRAVVGWLAAGLIDLTGFSVMAEGTVLNWGGSIIEIDAACSGIKMLWAAGYLTFTLSCAYQLTSTRTTAMALGALAAVVLANAVRSAALFYLEAGVVQLPTWSHTGAGMVVFVALACLLLNLAQQLREEAA